jgi:peptide/nickel transport system substrate-binding protein
MTAVLESRWTAWLMAALVAGCGPHRTSAGAAAGTVVVATVQEPACIFPPLVGEAVGRDISDLIYERLADLGPGRATTDTSAYRPRLAVRWERLDSLTWRFHLRPDARWQDGVPVTSEDVRFSFEAFADSTLDSPALGYLAGRVRVQVESPSAFLVRFAQASPEQLYDATYHVRIIPRHIWASRPPATWASDTDPTHLIGSGSYRLQRWKRAEFLTLEADPHAWRRARIERVLWRFTRDPDAAVNLVLAGEADLLEQVSPSQEGRFRSNPDFELRPYPSSMYGFLTFHVADSSARPHPIFGRPEVRRALSLAVDRATLAHALLGPGTLAPAGPMSRNLWIGGDGIAALPYDPPAAGRTLDSAGWRRGARGLRSNAGRALRFDILVPTSSTVRRQAAVVLQDVWHRLGAEVTVTAVDFPVFEQRIRRGAFDTYIGAYLDEPSARGIGDQFSRHGWTVLNFGRYANPAFDSLLTLAGAEVRVEHARILYREAMDTLNADAPAIFLYAPTNVAVLRRTLTGVTLDPYSWLADLPDWVVSRRGEQRLGLR